MNLFRVDHVTSWHVVASAPLPRTTHAPFTILRFGGKEKNTLSRQHLTGSDYFPAKMHRPLSSPALRNIRAPGWAGGILSAGPIVMVPALTSRYLSLGLALALANIGPTRACLLDCLSFSVQKDSALDWPVFKTDCETMQINGNMSVETLFISLEHYET